jgi:hypothetical protein
VQHSTYEFVRVMVTNALSPLRAIEEFGDLVAPNGTIAACRRAWAASPTIKAAATKSIARARHTVPW